MKKLIFAMLLLSQTSWASTATMPAAVSFSTQQKRVVANYTSWAQMKNDLKNLESKFNDPRLTEDQKVDLLPITNQLLSLVQDLNLNTDEKRDQITTVVELMAATLEYDFASSNQDVLYFDFAKNKRAYLEELSKLPQQKAEELKSIFAELQEVAAGMDSEAGEEY